MYSELNKFLNYGKNEILYWFIHYGSVTSKPKNDTTTINKKTKPSIFDILTRLSGRP